MTTAAAVDVLSAARDLHAALTELAGALETASLPGLVDVQPRLALAVAAFSAARERVRPGDMPHDNVRVLRAELESVHAAMKRCAVLGIVLDDIARSRCSITYDASGSAGPVVVRGGFAQKA